MTKPVSLSSKGGNAPEYRDIFPVAENICGIAEMAKTQRRRPARRLRPVRAEDIDRISAKAGYASGWQGMPNPEGTVLGGDFAIYRFPDGMSVHVTNGVEMSDCTSCFTLGPALSIFVLLEGYVAFDIAGETWELGAGGETNVETGLIWSRTRPTQVLRHASRGQQVCKVTITLDPEWFAGHGAELPPDLAALRARHLAQLQWCPSERTIRNARSIAFPHDRQPALRRLAIQSLALEVIHEAFSLFEAGFEQETDLPRQRAAEVRRYLDETLMQPLELGQIARDLGMSVTVLQDQFRTSFGMTVGEYRRRQRLLKAHAALRDEGISVAAAATVAGYRSAANFATAFAREFGYAPSKARS